MESAPSATVSRDRVTSARRSPRARCSRTAWLWRPLLRNGVGQMPAVGKDWPARQFVALFAYLNRRFGQGAGSGG